MHPSLSHNQQRKLPHIISIVALLLMTLAAAPAAYPAGSMTLTVTSVADAGDANPGDGVCDTGAGVCTLRAAIEEANALAGADTITFNIPGSGVQHIMVPSPLPALTAPVTIDGTTQPGAACATANTPPLLKIELDGTGTISTTNGLELALGSDGSMVKGLVINRFGGNGLAVLSSGATIACTIIGTDASGAVDLGNGLNGIALSNASNTLIGGTTPAARNLISGNDGAGIYILSGELEGLARPTAVLNNRVWGNYIGTSLYGVVALGNSLSGVIIDGTDATNNEVGGLDPHSGNLIAGNGENGVAVLEGASDNLVANNWIGLTSVGRWPLANTLQGVLIENAANTLVRDNVIAGNGQNGVQILDTPSSIATTGNQVRGNLIGTDVSGMQALPNGVAGVDIFSAASTIIGGDTPADRNIITGNTGDAVLIHRSSPQLHAINNEVRGNYLGLDRTGLHALGNGGDGVALFNAEAAIVHGNVIAGNSAGIQVSGRDSVGNIITGNIVGSDPSGVLEFGNGEHGIFMNSGATQTLIGGLEPGDGNLIAYHSGRGIWVNGATTLYNSIRGNSIHSNQGTEVENKLGIDLAPSGPNPIDIGDADTGPNDLQNAPEILGVYRFSGQTIVNLRITSAPTTTYAIDLFSNRSCDASGFGEGETYLQTVTVTTDIYGYGGLTQQLAAPLPDAAFLTATATAPNGDTSEFSNCVGAVDALVVNTTADTDDQACDLDGCSLREAINAANTKLEIDMIVFAIAGSWPHTLALKSPLPALTAPVRIDATTQPGTLCPAEIAVPPLLPLDPLADLQRLRNPLHAPLADTPPIPVMTPTLAIELDGSGAGSGAAGLTLLGGDSVVRGLAVNRFDGPGIAIADGAGNTVSCSMIGTDPAGSLDRGNGGAGIAITNSANNVIGGLAAADRNVISGNAGDGIVISAAGATHNALIGNFIGTDATGLLALGNAGVGIHALQASASVIGGSERAALNLIADNALGGVQIDGGTAAVTGNLIGVDIRGTSALGNHASGVTFADVLSGTIAWNVIAANASHGVALLETAAVGIHDNVIGSDIWRLAPLGNGGAGIDIQGLGSHVVANSITASGLAGIAVHTGSQPAVENSLSANAIYANTLLGIDLDADGLTPNDPGDSDTGANQRQNFPQLSAVATDGVTTVVSGSLASAPNTTYTVEVFVNLTCASLGYGEGQVLLGSLTTTTDMTGDATFVGTFATALPADVYLSATATDPAGNTSEFAQCIPAPPAHAALMATVSAASGLHRPGETVTYTLQITNMGNVFDAFTLAADGAWPVVLPLTTTATAAPGSSVQAAVVVAVPTTAHAGDTNVTTVTLASVNDPAVVVQLEISTVADFWQLNIPLVLK